MAENCDESEEERVKRMTWKWKQRQKACEVRSKTRVQEAAAASETKKAHGCLEKRSYPHVQ